MTKMHKQIFNDQAVSPVVGVMLMLVVTIIIAAIVSGVAGGMVSGQNKVPQATIQATFSQTGGMTITHAGGDPLPTANIIFMVSDNPEFGQGLGAVTTQVLNSSIVTDASGNALRNPDGTSNITAFKAGDSLYVKTANLDPQYFQPSICPCDNSTSYTGNHPNTNSPACTGKNNQYSVWWTGSGWNYDGSKTAFWNLNFVNSANVGKSFSLTVADKSGKLISRTDVTITS
jgi:FlaG/FlaF family flagellin (archaellin)